MSQAFIDKVSDIRPGKFGGISSKIHSGSSYWFVNLDATPYAQKTIQFDEENKGKYSVAHNLKVVENEAAPAAANGTKVMTWDQYETIIKDAHRLISELEPDGYGGPINGGEDAPQLITIDRSRARVAFLSTIVIAASNGKIAVGDDSDSVPF